MMNDLDTEIRLMKEPEVVTIFTLRDYITLEECRSILCIISKKLKEKRTIFIIYYTNVHLNRKEVDITIT